MIDNNEENRIKRIGAEQSRAEQSAEALLAERMQDHGGERQVASR